VSGDFFLARIHFLLVHFFHNTTSFVLSHFVFESRVQQKEEEEYEKIRKRAQEQEQHLAASREQAQAYHEENMKANKKIHRQLAINSQQLATLSAQVGELIAMLASEENISIG
jgi:uncharacterized protein YlxW (UPF0749 family)